MNATQTIDLLKSHGDERQAPRLRAGPHATLDEVAKSLAVHRPAGLQGVRPENQVRIAILDPYDLTRAGLTQLLTRSPAHPYTVVPLDGRGPAPEIVLYGVWEHVTQHAHDPRLHGLLRDTSSIVIATYWDDDSPLVESALRCGAHGALSKKLTAEQLAAALESIATSQDHVKVPPEHNACQPSIGYAGLTPREVDVLALLGTGLTNQEIAERLYVSINTVKTYIRCAYQKIGAQRRTQAVIWVRRHGLTAPTRPTVADEDHVAAE